MFDTLQKSRVLIRILSTIGILTREKQPNQKLKNRLTIFYNLMIHVSATFTLTILMWINVVSTSDLNDDVDVLAMTLTETALVVKILSVWYYTTSIQDMFNEWQQNELFKLQTTKEFVMWQQTFKVFGVVAFLYIICSLSVVGCGFAAVLFVKTYQLPFPYWVPFNWNDPVKFWYAYIYELYAMPMTCITNCTLDMFFCYMMQHLAMSYKLIAMRLEKLGCVKDEMNVSITKKLLTLIEFHQKLKRMSQTCEAVICYPILAEILVSASVLCFSLYRLQNFNILEDPVTFISLAQYAVAMNLQIFLPCYYANQLTVESCRLHNSIYNSNWSEMSLKNRKLILMFMQYLEEPVVLKAGNFFKIGLPIYSKTVNNAYSFFALLLNMDVK